MEQQKQQVEEVVVVGAGIAGLATAVALRRIGMTCLVLESHSELRNTGASLTLSQNAWVALEALGVADKLTAIYNKFESIRATNLETGTSAVISVGRATKSGEAPWLRPVHRKRLLEALAEEVPVETIRFSSKLVRIEPETPQQRDSIIALHLDDGSIVRTKVLVGCDGIHSVVAQWLGLSEPIKSGRSAVRGLAVFPEGHGMKDINQYLAKDIRAGTVPLNDTDIYWFLVNNSSGAAEKEMHRSPELVIQAITDDLAKEFPEEYLHCIRNFAPETVTWSPLSFRVPWDLLLHPAHRGTVTVAGDAFHPMTPDLGQGGCCALEDAVVLARCLHDTHGSSPALGIATYVKERQWRVSLITAGAYISGWIQQGGGAHMTGVLGWAVKLLRDQVFYPIIFPKIADYVRNHCGNMELNSSCK